MNVEPLGSIMSSALTPNPQGREHGNSRTDIAVLEILLPANLTQKAIVGSRSHATRHVADCEVFSKHLPSRTSRNTSMSREIITNGERSTSATKNRCGFDATFFHRLGTQSFHSPEFSSLSTTICQASVLHAVTCICLLAFRIGKLLTWL